MMDAARLVKAIRHALAQAGDAEAIVAEAWQARALVEAVGDRLDERSAQGVRAACDVPAGPIRAARLTGVRDPPRVLRALLETLAEVVAALVEVAGSTDEMGLYWRCLEAADAAHDAADRVRALIGRYEPNGGGVAVRRPVPRPP